MVGQVQVASRDSHQHDFTCFKDKATLRVTRLCSKALGSYALAINVLCMGLQFAPLFISITVHISRKSS